jgi:dTDP-4-amino-4,6-dideoxygalactose transaminase
MKGLYCDGILLQKDGYRKLFGMAEDMADGCTVAAPMSRVSRAIWSQLGTAAIVSARGANYAVLASGVSRLRSLHLFHEGLLQGVCPLGCPIVSPRRDDLRIFLTSQGVYCPIHWQLPAEVKTGFPASQSVSATILTLPCDQRYTTNDMDRVVTLLKEWDGSHPRRRDEGVG